MLHRDRGDAPREGVEGVRESARGGLGSVAEGVLPRERKRRVEGVEVQGRR